MEPPAGTFVTVATCDRRSVGAISSIAVDNDDATVVYKEAQGILTALGTLSDDVPSLLVRVTTGCPGGLMIAHHGALAADMSRSCWRGSETSTISGDLIVAVVAVGFCCWLLVGSLKLGLDSTHTCERNLETSLSPTASMEGTRDPRRCYSLVRTMVVGESFISLQGTDERLKIPTLSNRVRFSVF